MSLGLAVALFVAGLLLSTILTVAVLVMLPPDYFFARPEGVPAKRPPWAIVLLVLKNLAGAALLALGVVLSVPGVPGQGLLTIFAGLLLIDLPGKRRLELAVLRRPLVHRAVDGLRRRFGRPPLRLP